MPISFLNIINLLQKCYFKIIFFIIFLNIHISKYKCIIIINNYNIRPLLDYSSNEYYSSNTIVNYSLIIIVLPTSYYININGFKYIYI